MKHDSRRPVRLEDYRPPSHLVEKIDLNIRLDAQRTRIRSKMIVRANPVCTGAAGALQLDGEQLELEEIRLNGRQLSSRDYELSVQGLVIPNFPDDRCTIDVTTYVNPDANKALQGVYRSRGVYCSQCEAQGFRRITYFIDRPDVLAKYTVKLEAEPDDAPILLSNGNLYERGTSDRGRRHYAVWRDPFPKPCYLFALVGGNLGSIASTFKTMSGREIDLRIYVEHGKEARAAWAMDALKRAMAWDERTFGREYDLDYFNIVAVSDFNMGAMENKGLNIFNDRLVLASPETATDAIFEAIECVVAHEYFHNWTGNRITCRDWFQLCLKEGLTVFRDQEFSGDERSRTVQRIIDVRELKAHQFPEDQGPLAHAVRPSSYIEINNFYTATVYEKGAEVVRMLHTLLGAGTFRRGMDLYFDRFDGQAATVEDFLGCFETASGKDLGQFKLWYTQAGTPQLICKLDWIKSKRVAELTVTQVLPATPGEPRKKPLEIPIKLALIGENGGELPLQLAADQPVADGLICSTNRTDTFRFVDIATRPRPSVLRNFSAPVDLVLDLDNDDLEFLMIHDGDPFNRWQAGNTYAGRTLVAMVKALADGRRPQHGLGYARALTKSIGDETLEPAYRAELLRLPSQADVARMIGENVDPDLIGKAHRRLSKSIGTELCEVLEDIYDRLASTAAFSPDAASAGRRGLRNAALTLLSARDDPVDQARLARHYFEARSMTEAAHGLFLLAAGDSKDRSGALDHFYERWKDDHLVIDTWFAAQAQSPRTDTIDVIARLGRHPLFSITAPNKVRALIGNFAFMNPVQFNRSDGAGYALVVDHVLTIDRFNPQVAARMLGAFGSFKSLEPERQAHARRALKRVAVSDALSRDLGEIVLKMLEP